MRAGLEAMRIRGIDPETVAGLPDALLARNGLEGRDAVFYLQITRGVATRTHWFPDPAPEPTVYAAARAFTPSSDPAAGCSVITRPDHRWTRCDIKSVALLPNCMAAEDARSAGAYEAVLVRDGVALEGTRSNLFAVIDGVVRTAPLSNYILPGITRGVVLELCRSHAIPCLERPILLEELEAAEEVFLAGTTTEVLGVVEIDGRPVGAGAPGPVTLRIAELFGEAIATP
jgi:D-alanine transaminase